MSSILLECKKANDTSGNTSNAIFTNLFNPVTIEDGDIILIKNSFISPPPIDPLNITLDNDVTITISYGIYEFNCFDDDNKVPLQGYTNLGVKMPDYRLYYMMRPDQPQNNYEPWIIDYTQTIPAGTYSIAELCEIITKEANSLPYFYDQNGIPNNFYSSGFISSTFNNDTSLPFSFRLMYGPGSDNIQYRYKTAQDSGFKDSFVGATQFNIDPNYNNVTNNPAITYCHIPLYDQNGNLSIMLTNYKTTNASGYQLGLIPNIGGIFITDMQPYSFWSLLGFSEDYIKNSISVKYDNTGVTTSQSDFLNRIVGGYSTKSVLRTSNTNTTTPQVPAQDSKILVATNLTNAIISDQTITAQPQEGYYIIEMNTNIKTNYQEGIKEYSNIMAVVPKYFSDSYTTTGYADGSIQYQHKGSPQSLTEINIRILNSDKSVATLLENNTIYIEIIKQAQPILESPSQPGGRDETTQQEINKK